MTALGRWVRAEKNTILVVVMVAVLLMLALALEKP